MHILRGAPALSDFRRLKQLTRLQATVPGVSHVYAEFMHFAELDAPLDDEQALVLSRLLTYGPSVDVEEPEGTLVLVLPRFGTISPWSSKATDIAHNCGLGNVRRLERGIAWYIKGELTSKELAQVKQLLHDRMTEVALDELEAASGLFAHTEPKPFQRADDTTGFAVVFFPGLQEARNTQVGDSKTGQTRLRLATTAGRPLIADFPA